MQRSSLLIAIVCLAACDAASEDQLTEEPAGDIPAMLQNGDPKACAEPDAIETALGAANKEYADYLTKGGEPLKTDTISATEIKRDIHEISCSAVVHYRSIWSEEELSTPFEYKLRPTLDRDASFLAEVPDTRQIGAVIGTHLFWWESQKKPKEAAAPESSTELNGEDSAATDVSDDSGASRGGERTQDFTTEQQRLIDQWSDLEEACRGGTGDTKDACDNRDAALQRMNDAGVCYGKDGQYGAEYEVHICGPNSLR